jgi:hypothetical protein
VQKRKDRVKKKYKGFSTFLRGCNPGLPKAVYQISPLSGGKSKTILQKPKIGLLLIPKKY